MIDRRAFIHKTSLGFLSTIFFPSIRFYSVGSTSVNLASNIDLDSRLFKAAQKRKEGKINRAINLFENIINDYPSEVRAYDGLRKSLLLKKHREFDVFNLFKRGLQINPENKDFKERLAKEYVRIALGNNRLSEALVSSESLLLSAKKLFKELKDTYPERNEYVQQLKKVKRKIKQKADILDARGNVALKEYKKINKNSFKKRFKNKTVEEVEVKLNELLRKTRDGQRDVHIKELYKIIIKRYKKEQDFTKAYSYAENFYDYDQLNPIALQMVKKWAKKTEKFSDLVEITENNHNKKNTFWSNLNRFDAYFLQYKKTQIGNIENISNILNEVGNSVKTSRQRQEFLMRKIKIELKTNKLDQSKNSLLLFGDTIVGGGNRHNSLLFVNLSARYYKKIGKSNVAIQIIDFILHNSVNLPVNDSLSKIIYDIFSMINFENEQHIERLKNLRERIIINQT